MTLLSLASFPLLVVLFLFAESVVLVFSFGVEFATSFVGVAVVVAVAVFVLVTVSVLASLSTDSGGDDCVCLGVSSEENGTSGITKSSSLTFTCLFVTKAPILMVLVNDFEPLSLKEKVTEVLN